MINLENIVFIITSAVLIASTLMVVISSHPVHALLNLVLSSLAMALIFYLLGAPFSAALEVLVYAGAIMVLFIFVVMMLNLGKNTVAQEKEWLRPKSLLLPSILVSILLIELITIMSNSNGLAPASIVDAKMVGIGLYGPYLLAVELASILLMAGLVAAYHLGRPFIKNH